MFSTDDEKKTSVASLDKLNLSHPDPGQRKLRSIFIFTLLCGTPKALIKLFEAPQRSVKVKI